jgi:hypothetical protein
MSSTRILMSNPNPTIPNGRSFGSAIMAAILGGFLRFRRPAAAVLAYIKYAAGRFSKPAPAESP